MKTQYLLAMLLILGQIGFPQNGKIKGIARNGVTFENSPFVNISLTKNIDKKIIQFTNSDTVGNFEFQNIPQGVYDLNFSFIGYSNYTYKNIAIHKDSTTYLLIQFPCPNGTKSVKKKCPFGHRDNIIPIIYGLPSEKSLKKADQGKIELGGCIVTECDPKWYCKTHRIKY